MLEFLKIVAELVLITIAFIFENFGTILMILILVAVVRVGYNTFNKADGYCGTEAAKGDPNCAEVINVSPE